MLCACKKFIYGACKVYFVCNLYYIWVVFFYIGG